jgi:hypothetical protein
MGESPHHIFKEDITMYERYYSNDGAIYATVKGRADNGKTLWAVYYGKYPTYEEHELKLYKWARGLHGNAPSGTPYGYFRASRNGKRIIVTV